MGLDARGVGAELGGTQQVSLHGHKGLVLLQPAGSQGAPVAVMTDMSFLWIPGRSI